MHVALVSPYDPFPMSADHGQATVGGVERVFAQLATRLAGHGHEVTVISSSDQVRCPTRRLTDSNEPCIVRMPRRGTLLRAPIADLAGQIPDDADVVHVAATYPFTTPSVLRRADRLGIPSVLDFHFEPDPVSTVGRAAAGVYRRIGPRSYPLADVVMLRSTAYGRSAQSLARVPEDRWRIVPNGIDPQRFSCDDSTEGDYLLFVGRLVPYKGLTHLLDALAMVPKAPRLLIAGDGPLRRELEEKATRLGLDVEFLGRVDDDALPDLYRKARLTLLPSVGRQECFGITLLESMACGTPVVASELPGVADVAREGGVTARSGDATDLARQLAVALTPGRLPRGQALARRIHDRYSWDAVARSVEDVYSELVRRGETPVRQPTAVAAPA